MINRGVVLIGYSGHSYGCIEVAINQEFSVIGYHDILENIRQSVIYSRRG